MGNDEISLEGFSDWYDRERECLLDKYEREIENGNTESTFKEWSEAEYRLGIIIERIETEFEGW